MCLRGSLIFEYLNKDAAALFAVKQDDLECDTGWFVGIDSVYLAPCCSDKEIQILSFHLKLGEQSHLRHRCLPNANCSQIWPAFRGVVNAHTPFAAFDEGQRPPIFPVASVFRKVGSGALPAV